MLFGNPLKRLPLLLPVFPACVRRRVGPNKASALPTCHLFVSRHGLPIATCVPFAAPPFPAQPSTQLEIEKTIGKELKNTMRPPEGSPLSEPDTQSKTQKETERQKKQECQKKVSFG